MNRRQFLGTVAAAAVLPSIGRQVAPTNEWGAPVFDLHFHMRQQPGSNVTHLDGAGVTKANLLTRGAALKQVRATRSVNPARDRLMA